MVPTCNTVVVPDFVWLIFYALSTLGLPLLSRRITRVIDESKSLSPWDLIYQYLYSAHAGTALAPLLSDTGLPCEALSLATHYRLRLPSNRHGIIKYLVTYKAHPSSSTLYDSPHTHGPGILPDSCFSLRSSLTDILFPGSPC